MSQRPITQFAIYAIGILLGAVCLPVAADSPAAAADPQAAEVAVEPAAAKQPAPAQKPKLVCKSEKVTGSQIKRRTCRTQDQSAQDHRASQEYLDRVQGATGVNGGTAAGGL
jgi:predicted secreted protein